MLADTTSLRKRSDRPDPHAVVRTLTELTLVVLIAAVAARMVWIIAYGGDIQRLEISPATSAVSSEGDAGTADLSALVGSNLFADHGRPGGPAEAEAPETQLDLSLRGVRQSETPQAGSAIIEAPERGQRTLPAGAEIAPNVTLEAVYPDRVIINRAGRRESLFLREERTREPSLLHLAAQVPEPVDATPGPSTVSFSEEDWVLGLRFARAEENGNVLGYSIEASSDPRLLAAAGLEPGDIILTVNGRRLDRPINMLEVLEEVADSSRAEFTLLRGGQSRTIEANLR